MTIRSYNKLQEELTNLTQRTRLHRLGLTDAERKIYRQAVNDCKSAVGNYKPDVYDLLDDDDDDDHFDDYLSENGN